MKMLALALLALCATVSYSQKVYVPKVLQNYKTDIDTAIVDQIEIELSASYIYQAYASYFQRADVSLPGIQKFFADASKEERDHAQKLIEYVNQRGGHAQFDKLDLKTTCQTIFKDAMGDSSGLVSRRDDGSSFCICGFVATGSVNEKCDSRDTWKEGLMAFADALVMERFVNDKLLKLHAAADADDVKDAHLTHMLEHDMLEEQVHAIYEIANYHTRLSSFAAGTGSNYKLGEYLFDERLSKG